MILSRRSILVGAAASLAAPAVVRAASLMPIRGDVYKFWSHSAPLLPPFPLDPTWPGLTEWKRQYESRYLGPNGRLFKGTWTYYGKNHNIYSDELVSFERNEYPLHTCALT